MVKPTPSDLDRPVEIDPKEPVAAFSVNDRSTLELDLRRSRRANRSWRLRSFAPADPRPRSSQLNACIRKLRTGAADPDLSLVLFN